LIKRKPLSRIIGGEKLAIGRNPERHNMKRETERLTYNIEEAARMLGVGRNQAYDAAKRGDIPTIKIGKRLLVPKKAFDRKLDGGDEPDDRPPVAA